MRLRPLCLALLCMAPLSDVSAQRNRGFGRTQASLGDPNEFYRPPDFNGNARYDGRFTFVRIKYRGYEHFMSEGPGWSHDYPRAEEHLMRIMRSISALHPFVQSGNIVGGNILALDDPELFKYPVAYLSEPGGWHPNDAEVAGLQKYLTKGGFLIIDDFEDFDGGDWPNFVAQMQKTFPKLHPIEIPRDHPIFDSFFKINLDILGARGRGSRAVWYGIFQDNDPKKRILVVANYLNDIGESWQWSERGFNVVPTNEAYKLGVNYLIYALTH